MEVIRKEEVFSIEDQETRDLMITSYSLAEVHFPEYSDASWDIVIPPRTFRALKIFISKENGIPVDRHYWIDSKRLIFGLLNRLERYPRLPREYRIKKHGVPPKSQYEVSFTPAGVRG